MNRTDTRPTLTPELQRIIADAYETAMDQVLGGYGQEYGNLMEARMVAEEIATGGGSDIVAIRKAEAFLNHSNAWLVEARAAGERARYDAIKELGVL